MSGEISLEKTDSMRTGDSPLPDEEQGWLRRLAGKIESLLARYQELVEERDSLAAALDLEREKVTRLERRLELLNEDREKVKTRIDHLLHRLKGVDL